MQAREAGTAAATLAVAVRRPHLVDDDVAKALQRRVLLEQPQQHARRRIGERRLGRRPRVAPHAVAAHAADALAELRRDPLCQRHGGEAARLSHDDCTRRPRRGSLEQQQPRQLRRLAAARGSPHKRDAGGAHRGEELLAMAVGGQLVCGALARLHRWPRLRRRHHPRGRRCGRTWLTAHRGLEVLGDGGAFGGREGELAGDGLGSCAHLAHKRMPCSASDARKTSETAADRAMSARLSQRGKPRNRGSPGFRLLAG